MRTLLLTTDTPHHLSFAWRVAARHPWTAVIVEAPAPPAPFPTRHPFEDERDAVERAELLSLGGATFNELAPTHRVSAVNDDGELVRSIGADVAIVFGTGRLVPAIISTVPTFLNLHGGDPERYRGLDSHLWAIYHRDFDSVVTTLHHVDAELDTGAIVVQTALPLAGLRLAELRAVNTRACVDLSLAALDLLAAGTELPQRRQRERGRYYSHMPAVLKDRCLTNLDEHVAGL